MEESKIIDTLETYQASPCLPPGRRSRTHRARRPRSIIFFPLFDLPRSAPVHSIPVSPAVSLDPLPLVLLAPQHAEGPRITPDPSSHSCRPPATGQRRRPTAGTPPPPLVSSTRRPATSATSRAFFCGVASPWHRASPPWPHLPAAEALLPSPFCDLLSSAAAPFCAVR